MGLWGLTTEFVGFIPQSLVLWYALRLLHEIHKPSTCREI